MEDVIAIATSAAFCLVAIDRRISETTIDISGRLQRIEKTTDTG
jgi:hypothetical protein